jgi:hypothetical protein
VGGVIAVAQVDSSPLLSVTTSCRFYDLCGRNLLSHTQTHQFERAEMDKILLLGGATVVALLIIWAYWGLAALVSVLFMVPIILVTWYTEGDRDVFRRL